MLRIVEATSPTPNPAMPLALQSNAIAGGCAPFAHVWHGSPGCGLLPFVGLVMFVVSHAIRGVWLLTVTSPPSRSKSVPSPPPPRVRAARVPVTPCPTSRLGAESPRRLWGSRSIGARPDQSPKSARSEEHTSELQSPLKLV